MRSIFEQTYPVFETLVLDDCSTDDSLAELDDIARASGRRFRVVANNGNSGSPFAQWERGCRLARGKYVWVAEADDDSDARFLEEIVLRLRREGASFAFSDSVPIDQNGVKLAESYKDYYREAVGALMDSSFELDGKRSWSAASPNATSCSTRARSSGTARCSTRSPRRRDALKEYRLAGDWHLYSAVALREGRVAYISSPLNLHRRHDSSVTATVNGHQHVEEVERVQGFVAEALGVNDTARRRMRAYAEAFGTSSGS